HFCQSCLPGLPPSDAALRLPALGRDGRTARGTGAGLGEAKPAAGVQNAASGRTAGRSPDSAVVSGPNGSGTMARRFLRDETGATAIEYALIAAGISVAIVVSVSNLGSAVSDMWNQVKNAL